MRSWFAAIVLGAVIAAGCGGDGEGAASTTIAAPTTATPSTVGSTSTVAPTTQTTSAADAVANGVCPQLPATAAPDPARPVYTVTVDARPQDDVVEGQLAVRFTPDLDTDQLVFRLWPNGPRPSAVGAHLDAGPVTSGGTELPTSQPDPTTLVVALAEPLAAGHAIEVTMPWRLAVPGSVRDRISHSGDTLRLGSFLPILAWEAGVGWATEPPTSGFGEATTSPAADYDVAITVPAGYDVLASGQRDPDGHWRLTAGRDFAISIGHFSVASATVAAPEPVEVSVGVDEAVDESPDAYLVRVTEALTSFATRFGPYPWPTLTLALTPELGGGIEFPTHIMQGPDTIGRTTPHEVGHMWFYSLVGNNQGRDPWLDEGLASYAEFTHEGVVEESRETTIPGDAVGRASEPMTYWEGHQDSYYRGVYLQSGNALTALGGGNLGFTDCALRHYVAANAFRIARPADLFEALLLIYPDAAETMAPAGLHP